MRIAVALAESCLRTAEKWSGSVDELSGTSPRNSLSVK